jgi:hypothetical protein
MGPQPSRQSGEQGRGGADTEWRVLEGMGKELGGEVP